MLSSARIPMTNTGVNGFPSFSTFHKRAATTSNREAALSPWASPRILPNGFSSGSFLKAVRVKASATV